MILRKAFFRKVLSEIDERPKSKTTESLWHSEYKAITLYADLNKEQLLKELFNRIPTALSDEKIKISRGNKRNNKGALMSKRPIQSLLDIEKKVSRKQYAEKLDELFNKMKEETRKFVQEKITIKNTIK